MTEPTHEPTLGRLPAFDVHDDDQLLAALGAVLDEAEPIPSHLHAYASALFELGGLDAELAELTFDSLIDDAPVLVRASEQPRVIVYTGAMLSIEIEITAEALLGQLAPPGPASVTLQTPTASTAYPVSKQWPPRYSAK